MPHRLSFADRFLATGIGSLPHKRGREAIEIVLRDFPEIPFVPQLPKVSPFEGMIVQYSEGFPSIRWDEKLGTVWVDTSSGFDREVERFYQWIESGEIERFSISERFSKGLKILNELASSPQRELIRFVKGQVTGPVTFGLSLTDLDRTPVFHDPTLREIVIKHLTYKAMWIEKKFRTNLPERESIVFIDEPALSSYGSAFFTLKKEDVILSLDQCLKALSGLKGIHCCGNTDWETVLELDLDILSFDAFNYFGALSLYHMKLKSFLERGGILAWGIVPTNEVVLQETGRSLSERLKGYLGVLEKKGIDPHLLCRAIVTPSCGAGTLSVDLAERVCTLTREVSLRMRESYP